jgi:hypothetical protein
VGEVEIGSDEWWEERLTALRPHAETYRRMLGDGAALRWERARPMVRDGGIVVEPGWRLMFGPILLVRVSRRLNVYGCENAWRWYVPGRPLGMSTFRTASNIVVSVEKAKERAERFVALRFADFDDALREREADCG